MFKFAEFDRLIENGIISFDEYVKLKDSVRPYFYILPIFFAMDGINNLLNKKKRQDGTVNMREFLLPEFNHSDEREAVLTGKSAKAALAVVLFYTVFILLSYSLFTNSQIPATTYMIFATASIPIVGLLTYYLSYRYYYAK